MAYIFDFQSLSYSRAYLGKKLLSIQYNNDFAKHTKQKDPSLRLSFEKRFLLQEVEHTFPLK